MAQPIEILIVDDSPTQAMVLRHLLQEHGYQVRAASDGKAGLQAAREGKPALIISDVLMPEMNGYEMCQAIKQDAALADVPVILLTTLSDAEDVVRGLEARADYYINKPFDEKFLLVKVQSLLSDTAPRHDPEPAEAVELVVAGKRHAVTSTRQQILNLLLSTYENAVQQNRELIRTQFELKAAHQLVREERNLLRAVIDNLPDRIFVKDLKGRYLIDNRAHTRFVRAATSEEVTGKTAFDFFPAAIAARAHADDQTVLASGLPVLEREEPVSETPGNDQWIATTKVPLRDTHGGIIGLVGLNRDITDRKRAERQIREQNTLLEATAKSERAAHEELKKAQSHLVQTEKLASLGQMVAGIAHEINNPLTFVLNNVVVLQRDLGALGKLVRLYQQVDPLLAQANPALQEEIQDLSERIDVAYTLDNLHELGARSREGLKRIQQIVRDLRDFARLDSGDLSEADLNAGIASTVNIIHVRAHQKHVEIRQEFQPLPLVLCYPAKINQVVMNLLTNAIDACRPGGAVVVRTSARERMVEIQVQDNGTGISPAIRERIFDPFFTTKPPGEGTGLGLSISYGIVRDHAGQIEVHSEPGQGATFTVRIPLRPPPEMHTDHLK